MSVEYNQASFVGGMNFGLDATKIAENEYYLLVNGRARRDVIETIKLPLRHIKGLPGGKFQGVYGYGSILLVFIAGKAYYRDFEDLGVDYFTLIPSFSLSATVDILYAQALPASTVNFSRVLESDDRNSPVRLISTVGGSPQCILVQDGLNQPWVIFSNLTARVTQDYLAWTPDDTHREYVPIGKFMIYNSGKLYVAGFDATRRLTQIFHSVSGRPLDFMVNIDKDGNRGPSEDLGGAASVSHRVEFNELTALANIELPEGGFYASTLYNSWIVTPNFDKPLFGEPTFNNAFLFSTGALNPNAVVDIVGDTALIDQVSIRSFNAVVQLKTESQNSPFSARIDGLFDSIIQDVCCAKSFNNYAFFGVQTIYGPAVVVFDAIRKTWVSVDIYPGVGQIKQFADLKIKGRRKLFFITSTGELYEAFASVRTATTRFYPGEWATKTPKVSQKITGCNIILSNIMDDVGSVQASLYVDRVLDSISEVEVNLGPAVPINEVPSSVPLPRISRRREAPLHFDFSTSREGWKAGICLEWNFEASLSFLQAEGETSAQASSMTQKAGLKSSYGDKETNVSMRFAFFAENGVDVASTTPFVEAIKSFEPDLFIGGGGHNYPSGDESTWNENVDKYWGKELAQKQALFALGRVELETLAGKAHLLHTLNSFRYFSYIFRHVEIFFLNPGIKLDSSVIEPDGNTYSSKQGLWLKNALNVSLARIKVVVCATPPYTSCVNLLPGFTALRWPFKSWGANVVLSGTAPTYERLRDANGMDYVVCGLGGAVTPGGFSSPISQSNFRYRDSNYTFLLCEADKFNLDIKAYTVNKTLIDRLTINT